MKVKVLNDVDDTQLIESSQPVNIATLLKKEVDLNDSDFEEEDELDIDELDI